MIYAAEEVELQGSMEIAREYANQNKDVKGVINFDGTNFKGSDIYFALIQDNTDHQQNKFIARLIDTYIKLPWGYDKCHYACSDHYSWHYNGYKASFPGEARVKEENPHIHTAKDTLEVSQFSVTHATHFAKLGIMYLIKMDENLYENLD
jgi:leucyl aminopeptidase